MTGLSPQRLAFFAIFLATFQGSAAAQIESVPTKATTEKLPDTFHCGTREDLGMSRRDKACYWWTQSFNAPMISGASFSLAASSSNQPNPWMENSTSTTSTPPNSSANSPEPSVIMVSRLLRRQCR